MTQIPDDQLQALLDTAHLAADKARGITGAWFRTDMSVQDKTDSSPVTIADEQTEQVIRDIILQRHPDHGFFGEETRPHLDHADWKWVIDPIDGTKSFATGMPTFGTLISVLYQGSPVIGIIDHCVLDERWVGICGQPTTHNGETCRTRSTQKLENASVYTTTTDMFDDHTAIQASRLTGVCKFRVFGGDCYGYGLIASGFNDLMCEADLKPYDYFALVPVVTGAGGVISDWQGNPLTMNSNGEVLASANINLHNAALERLNSGS